MLRTISVALLASLASWLLWGCGPTRELATASPTWEAVPTFTPTTQTLEQPAPLAVADTSALVDAALLIESTMMLSPTVTIEPIELLPSATPTPSVPISTPIVVATSATTPLLIVSGVAVNVRGGPGLEYSQIGLAEQNAQYPLIGRNAAGDWWQVCCFGEQPGWLYAELVTVQNMEQVAVATAAPPAIVQLDATPTLDGTIIDESASSAKSDPATPEAPPAIVTSLAEAGTAGNFDPNAQYQIVHFRALGFDDNNGGIFDKGSQQLIFVTVLDQSGNGVDGVVIKDAVGDKLNIITGSKGPGKAEIKMDWDPYKLYVASDGSGLVTSQVSNQMNNPYPHIPDIIGLMGPADNEYAICPTATDRCEPPFYHAHWSYEITFQRVR